MKIPGEYKNTTQGLGRVVDAILDPVGSSTGLLYEKTANDIRASFEAIRTESKATFLQLTDHMLGTNKQSGASLETLENLANKHGISVDNDVQRAVLSDWNRNGQLSAGYKPKFMVDTGRPVRLAFYEAVGKCVENLRSKHPEYAQAFDALLKSGNPHNLIDPDKFVYKGTEMGRGFSNAVRSAGFSNALDFQEAKTYAALNPAPAHAATPAA